MEHCQYSVSSSKFRAEIFSSVAMIFAQIPWMLPYARLVPSWRKKQQALRVAGSAIANDRVERGTTSRDLWYHLVSQNLV